MDDRNNETGMKDTDMSEAPVKDRIEWIGMDGIMVLGYFVLAAIMFCSIKYHIDVLTAFVFPLTLLAIVFTVTINYAKTLRSFIKTQNQKIKKNK